MLVEQLLTNCDSILCIVNIVCNKMHTKSVVSSLYAIVLSSPDQLSTRKVCKVYLLERARNSIGFPK